MLKIYRKLKSLKKKYSRSVIALAVAVSLLILGAGLCIGMVGGELMFSADCGAMAKTVTFCPMQLAKMLADGQQLLSTILMSDELTLIAALAAGAVASAFWFALREPEPDPQCSRQAIFRRRNSILKLFDYLLRAYARGILAPKLYA